MKKTISFLSLLFGLFVCVSVFSACGGGDDDKNGSPSDTYSLSYFLTYKGETYMKYVDWENSRTTSFLRLEFSEGIPKGSEWNLYCDEPWIKLRNKRGKVNLSSEDIPFTIEDNTNYEDREANIYLVVDNGIPTSSKSTTVIIHQYGYETHLDSGKTISFTTNRSISESSELSITSLKVYQIMDVDWGDGNKDVLTKNEYYSTSDLSISHEYSSNKTYTVKLRFAPENEKTSFSFIVRKKQGLEKVSYYSGRTDPVNINATKHSVSIDNTKNVAIFYSDESGFDIRQY